MFALTVSMDAGLNIDIVFSELDGRWFFVVLQLVFISYYILIYIL